MLTLFVGSCFSACFCLGSDNIAVAAFVLDVTHFIMQKSICADFTVL